MASPLGQRVGNYILQSELGSGSFAQVYLGKHVHLGSLAAIKVLSARLQTAEMVESFNREAKLVKQLQHANIVEVLDYFVLNGLPYLVMEHASGGALSKLHPVGTQVSLTEVIRYAKDIAAGLDYAHGWPQHPVIHRDVKPQNILVGKNGEAQLSDFGIALVKDATIYSPGKKGIGGTPVYMSPEQWNGDARTASDQYALGIMVYQWLEGKPPFAGPTYQAFGHQHCNLRPPRMSQAAWPIPPGVEQVVMKALEKDPDRRFTSAGEFARELEQAANSKRISVPIGNTPPPTLQLSRKVRPTTQQLNKELSWSEAMLERARWARWWVKLMAVLDVLVAPFFALLVLHSLLACMLAFFFALVGSVFALVAKRWMQTWTVVWIAGGLFAVAWGAVGWALGAWVASGIAGVALSIVFALVLGLFYGGYAHGLVAQKRV